MILSTKKNVGYTFVSWLIFRVGSKTFDVLGKAILIIQMSFFLDFFIVKDSFINRFFKYIFNKINQSELKNKYMYLYD